MSESFQVRFYQEYNVIAKSLDEIESKLDSEASEADKKLQFASEYEKISARIDALQRYFGEYTSTLPTFEVRKAQEHLAKLSQLTQEKRDSLMPKKKFGFKSKQNVTTLESKIEAEAALVKRANNTDISSNINVESSIFLKGLSNQNVVKLKDEINDKDIAIVDTKNSTIILQGKQTYRIKTCLLDLWPRGIYKRIS